jgi:predicted Zn-dependent protease
MDQATEARLKVLEQMAYAYWRYGKQKREWLETHPFATPMAIAKALIEIAEKLGL